MQIERVFALHIAEDRETKSRENTKLMLPQQGKNQRMVTSFKENIVDHIHTNTTKL